MKRSTITIPAPVACPREKVEAFNYRKKHGQIWEMGFCISANYRLDDSKEGEWLYTVILKRRAASGDVIRLYVGDDGIRRI